jgi:hypothetical protein
MTPFITPFTPLFAPSEVEFFSIYTRNGIKYIHLWGYTYETSNFDYQTEDNPDGTYWANMEACGVEIPLAEFLKESKGYDSPADYVNDLYEQAKQYQNDYDEDGIVEVINHYYRDIVFSVDERAKNEGMPDAWLGYDTLTMDTPDGDYIC